MNKIQYNIISSSSKGNAILINDFFLLDCGVSYTKIKPYLKTIKIIFVSHGHTDHLNSTTVKQVAYNKPNIKFIVGSTDLVDKLLKLGVKSTNIYPLISNKKYDLGMLKVKLVPLQHDVPNHGIKFEISNKKGIYLVDTNSVENINAKNYDLFLIEANYKEVILNRHKQEIDDIGDFDYLYRVEKVHLSYEKALDFLIQNMGNNSVYEYIHKSDYNFEE